MQKLDGGLKILFPGEKLYPHGLQFMPGHGVGFGGGCVGLGVGSGACVGIGVGFGFCVGVGAAIVG